MLISNGTVVTWGEPNEVLPDYAVYIEGDKIVAVGPSAELSARYPDSERIDAHGQYIMPGNICAHTHYYGAFSRGMAIPGAPSKDFPEILSNLWWPLDKALSLEDVRYSALIFMVDAIRHGTTTLFDHHASQNAIEGSLDVIAEAVDEAGLRSVLCYELTDRDGPARSRAGIEENVRFIERTRREAVAGGRVQATFGMHASMTLSDATLDAARDAAPEGTGFHIHVAEGEADEYDSLAKYGTRIVDRLNRHGILGPRTIVGHGVHIDAKEIGILAETGTWVSHQPRSNMNNAVGVSQVEAMLRAGIPVCIGTDGFSHTMWEEWKFVYFLHKVWNRDPRRMNGMDVVQMGVYNNAKLAGVFYPDAPLGVIQPGAYADLILVDYHAPTPLSAGNLPWQIIFGFNESMITTTIASGKVLMYDHKLTCLDEEAITARARELVAGTWERYNRQF